MNYSIAGLIVNIPTMGDLGSRCSEYICNEKSVDITISEKECSVSNWPLLSKEDAIYLESGFQFYRKLLKFDGIMIHASAVELDGKVYLFSGACGVGKSTHTQIWKKLFGDNAFIINDDKPALRWIDEEWIAYGTPWCGKDGINTNRNAKLAGICFLKQGTDNSISRLSKSEALQMILSQTAHKFKFAENLDLKLNLVEKLICNIPMYELINNATTESAMLSYETMRKGAEEAGL